jgi:hypothetical protein
VLGFWGGGGGAPGAGIGALLSVLASVFMV